MLMSPFSSVAVASILYYGLYEAQLVVSHLSVASQHLEEAVEAWQNYLQQRQIQLLFLRRPSWGRAESRPNERRFTEVEHRLSSTYIRHRWRMHVSSNIHKNNDKTKSLH